MSERGELSERPRVAWRPVLLVAGIAAVVHLAVASRYGWHRDEFYYVISGRHLAFGYPDQPPLTPLLARLAADLPGGVFPLRVLAIAAQAGCILLTAVLAAEFGGKRNAQLIAAGATAACPIFVGSALLFGTTVTDQLAWVALLVLVTRALRLGTIRAWLWAGLAGGIGLENKDTIGVLLLGIAVGLVIMRRPVLRTPGPWLAGGLAIVIAIPNIAWNISYGWPWPMVRMAAVLSARSGGPLGSLAMLPLLALLLAGPFLVALWVFGVRWLGSAAGREQRWLLVAAIVVVVLCTASGGKDYYPAPVLTGLFAAGAVWAEARAEAVPAARARARYRRWIDAIVVTGVTTALISYPILPPAVATAVRPVDQELMETYGWSGIVDQINRVASTYPAGTVVFTSNYGEAGALTILGPDRGFHQPVASGQNAYGLWAPPAGSADPVLCVGEFSVDYLHRFWSQVTMIGPITLPAGLKDEETSGHAAIYLCRQPHGTWAQMWPGMARLS